jgi:hypothetical protein
VIRARALAIALAAAASCTPVPTSAPAPTPTATPETITVTGSAYGRVAVRAWPDARCIVTIHVPAHALGDSPPGAVNGTAGADGTIALTYDTPRLPKGVGQHEVSCTGAAAQKVSADFTISGDPILASAFTARVRTGGPQERVGKATVVAEPALVPLRDSDVAALARSLTAEWSTATRGLGTLTLAPSTTADIVVTVLAARGTSVLIKSDDGSEAIFLYVSDERGPHSADNFVAVALHELGHIWCCTGPDASADGHWAGPVADPLLQGVDQFGVMNHPVQCVIFAGAVESCPNRFSERELRTMGFTSIPPPPRNTCLDTKNGLKAQLATQDAAVHAGQAAQDALLAQIKAIDAQYPSKQLPPDVFARYTKLVDQYNAGVGPQNQRVAAYNAIATQLNGLFC